MINIREITNSDYNDVKRVGLRYAKETLVGELTEEQLFVILSNCVSRGIVYVAEVDSRVVGVIAGRLIDELSVGRICEEVIWYVEPENRGLGLLLFKKFMIACKKSNCVGVAMVAYKNEHFNLVDKFYKKNGFEEVETKYFKKI